MAIDDEGKVSTTVLGWTLGAVAVVGVVATGVAVWALAAPREEVAATPEPSSTAVEASASPSATPSPTADGPAIFIGDELDSLLLSHDTIQQLFPSATEFQTSAIYGHAGESEGIVGDPIICMPFVFEDPTFIVGYRSTRWSEESWDRQLSVRQFPTEAVARSAFEAVSGAASACDEYWYTEGDTQPPMRFAVTTAGEREGVSYLVGESTSERTEWWTDSVKLYAWHGNVMITLTSPIADGRIDDETIITAVLDQISEARALLAE